MTLDIILSGGLVVDGTGNPWFKADVGVKDGRIVKVGRLKGFQAEEVIDVRGLVVAPGFIDMHSHSDLTLWVNPKIDNKIRQGVTTEVVGNCGTSPAPLKGEALKEAERFIESLPGGAGKKPNWSTLAEYHNRLEEQGVPVNVAVLLGHSTIRMCVMGCRGGPPTGSEMDEMKALVAQGMEEGAFGISTGLVYAPGCYAETSEIIELASVVAEYGGIYVTHMRNEGNHLYDALMEAIEIGKCAGLPVQISHHKAAGRLNWGKVKVTLKIMEDARRNGVDITCDVYPYTAGCTWCLSPMLPNWILEGGVEAMIERLRNPEVREKIRRRVREGVGVSPLLELGEWDSIVIGAVKTEKNRRFEGKTVAEIAEMRGVDPLDCIFDLIVEEEDEITSFFFTMNEEDVHYVIKHPLSMIGSDAVPQRKSGLVHPRCYGTFPRVIRRYVNETRTLTLEEAIRKMTSAPAQRLGLRDRGQIREGFWADITVFNPRTIRDEATYEDPYRYPVGIEYVLVNGTVAVEEGRYNGSLAGKVLRKETEKTTAS